VTAPSSAATRYESFDVPKTITKIGTTTSTIEIGEAGLVENLDVELDIGFLWDEDLDVYLVGPGGTAVELFTDVGGSGVNFSGTVLDDEAATSIRDGAAPFTGRYRPEGRLADLTGTDRQGTWKLEITNDGGWFSGTLNSWALVLRREGESACAPPPEPTNPEPGDGASGVSIEPELVWGIGAGDRPAFRFLAATGEEGAEPFSLYELRTDPPEAVLIDDNCGVYALDFSPTGELYGCSEYALWKLDIVDGQVACTNIGEFRSATDDSVLMTGLAFRPEGALYGSTFDLITNTSVIYRIDKATAYVTEVCRLPIWNGIAWAIDFSPDGKLYAAFQTLLLIDLDACKETLLGDVLATDLDWAPDGFLYSVDEETRMLYTIDPSLAVVVAEVGPYDIAPWGLATQVLGTSSTNRPAQSAGAGVRSLRQGGHDRRALKVELLRRLSASQSAASSGAPAHAPAVAGAAPTVRLQALAEDPNRVTFDVFFDTADPPTALVCGDVEMQTCRVGPLDFCTRYYWQVVAKNACGETAAGPVWSFRTESVPADFDQDCDVDLRDLAVFASYWMMVSD
jgi:subtilisin-like proprotein convertase family protein